MWTVYLIYQFHAPLSPLLHRCAILYTRLFSLFLSRRILFFHPEKSERLQGRPAYAAASPGAKRTKTDAVSYYLWGLSCIQVLFFGTDAAACPCCRLLGQIRWQSFCRKCGPPPLFGLQVPAGSPAAFGHPAGTAPTPLLVYSKADLLVDFPPGVRYNKYKTPQREARTMAQQLSTDEIYRTLESEILSLKIPPNDTLSENQLCKRFNVSRTPIRSVLQRLEQNHFVQIIPCKGTIVTAINIDIVNQIIYQRVAVESMVLRDFVKICTPVQLAEVEHAFNLIQQAAQGSSQPEVFDINHFLEHDLHMHQIWFEHTNKQYLWQQITRPQADYSRFIRLDIIRANNVPDVLAEHKEMLRIITEKDLDAIEPLISRHLYGGIRRLGDILFSEEYRELFQ